MLTLTMRVTTYVVVTTTFQTCPDRFAGFLMISQTSLGYSWIGDGTGEGKACTSGVTKSMVFEVTSNMPESPDPTSITILLVLMALSKPLVFGVLPKYNLNLQGQGCFCKLRLA